MRCYCHHLTGQATQVQKVQVNDMPSSLMGLGRIWHLIPAPHAACLLPVSIDCSAVSMRTVLLNAGSDPAPAPLHEVLPGSHTGLSPPHSSPQRSAKPFLRARTGQAPHPVLRLPLLVALPQHLPSGVSCPLPVLVF